MKLNSQTIQVALALLAIGAVLVIAAIIASSTGTANTAPTTQDSNNNTPPTILPSAGHVSATVQKNTVTDVQTPTSVIPQPLVVIHTSATGIQDEINQWAPMVAQVECKWFSTAGLLLNDEYSSGITGIKSAQNIGILMTNRHLLLDSYGNSPDVCNISFPGETNLPGSGAYITLAVNQNTSIFDDMDIPNPNIDFGELWIKNPNTYLSTYTTNFNECTSRPSIGDQVLILGYQQGETQILNMTANISSVNGGYDNISITSPIGMTSVPYGMSGGPAISVKNNCYIGITSDSSILDFNSLRYTFGF